ncbi:MAG: nicotinate-nucleotide adenylyltransferase [Planctomycetaceae bacterium]
MRIGLFGGTFDPIHFGHLLMAEQCREQCQLDVVRFIPAFQPPHKPGVPISPAKDRIAMLELALAGEPKLEVSRIEMERKGKSYTVDTLRRLHETEPEHEFVLIIGADSLTDLPTWREPAEILQLATIAAVNRGRTAPSLDPIIAAVGESCRQRIQLVDMPAIDLSATDIRSRVASGRSIRYMTQRSVAMYVKQHRLYLTTPNPQPEPKDARS